MSLTLINQKISFYLRIGNFKCKNLTYSSMDDSLRHSTCCLIIPDRVKSPSEKNLLVSSQKSLTQSDLQNIYSKGVIKCLPSFIIAGTQKSGTTALSGWNNCIFHLRILDSFCCWNFIRWLLQHHR